jgi:hypothetical protein
MAGFFTFPILENRMLNSVFGQLTFSMFITVPMAEGRAREKRVRLATVYCQRSECDEQIEAFKASNERIASMVFAEFSFRETLDV